jgi:DNA-binding GntR family transcriptional regulator
MKLIAACPKQALIELIRQIMQRTRRYEMALMRDCRNVAVATANHKGIMAALISSFAGALGGLTPVRERL